MSLRETQKLFSAALLVNNSNHSMENLICSSDELSAKERLDIYRSTGITAQINALNQIYPVCEQIVGARSFAHLARNYALTHASLSSDLNNYGDGFFEYVDKVHREHGYTDYYYLKDLCLLERLWHLAYYAKDDSAFDFMAFQAEFEEGNEIGNNIGNETILNLSHSLEIMKTEYPVHLIWQQHKNKLQKAVVKSTQETYYLCIYRDGFQPKVEAISDSVFEFLLACKKGMSLQSISADSKYTSAMTAIPELIQRGWICSFNSRQN